MSEMRLEEWHPSAVGDQLSGHYGRQGGNAVIQTDDGLMWSLPHVAEVRLQTIDPDIGQSVTVTYGGRNLHGDEQFRVAVHG
jgi:hypothetical protein